MTRKESTLGFSWETFFKKSGVSFTYEGWVQPRGARKWSMYSATLLVSEPQSLTMGLPGGILLGTGHFEGSLWILGTR